MSDYTFRPHHLMCNYCFIGKGYNNKFIQNFININNDLNKNPHKTIKLIDISDDICKECQHNQDNKCITDDKITSIDKKHMEVLGLTDKQELSWATAKKIINDSVTEANFHYMCHTCGWYNLGICYNQLFKIPKGETNERIE